MATQPFDSSFSDKIKDLIRVFKNITDTQVPIPPIPVEDIDAGEGGAISPFSPTTLLHGSDGSGDDTYTLQDGPIGFPKKIKFVSTDGMPVTVVPQHLQGDDIVILLEDVGDYVVLVWDDIESEWVIVER